MHRCLLGQLVRGPLCVWCAYVAIRDAYHWYLRDRERSVAVPTPGSVTHNNNNINTKEEPSVDAPSTARPDPMVSLESVQPLLMIPSAMGSLLIAGLDIWWLATWSLPKLLATVIPQQSVRAEL